MKKLIVFLMGCAAILLITLDKPKSKPASQVNGASAAAVGSGNMAVPIIGQPSNLEWTIDGYVSKDHIDLDPGETKSYRNPDRSVNVSFDVPTGMLVHVAFSEGNKVGLFPQKDSSILRLNNYDVRGGERGPVEEGSAWVTTFTNKSPVAITITAKVLWKR